MGTTVNGWEIDGPLRQYKVPDTDITLTLTAYVDGATVLLYAAWRFNSAVMALRSGDTGGYDRRPIGGLNGGTSNHRSGTAEDLNYSAFPQYQRRMNDAQRAACRAIVAECAPALTWGGNWDPGSLDEQHFELATTDRAALRTVASKLRGGSESVNPPTSFKSPTGLVGSTPSGQTANTADSTAEILTPIGPAKQHAVIPLTHASYHDVASNRLAKIKVAGVRVGSDVSTRVSTAQMSFSSTQIGQFSLTVEDTEDGEILNSGLFAKGSSIDWGDQHLDVRSLTYRAGSGAPQLTVKARSRVISVLKGPEHQGKGSWGDVDVSAWVHDVASRAGAHVRVQPDLGRLTLTRQVYDSEESTWDVMVRAARTVGCLCFEYEQIITFMRPTTLANRVRARWWELNWKSNFDYTDGISGMPEYSWSLDGEQEQLKFELVSRDGDLARPGDGVTLTGRVGEAKGNWMITDVAIPVSNARGVPVTCARIVNPEPEAVNSS